MAVGALAVAACCALLTARAKPFEAMLPAQTTKAETQSNIHVTYKMYRAIPTHLEPMLDAGECVPKLGIRYARADAARDAQRRAPPATAARPSTRGSRRPLARLPPYSTIHVPVRPRLALHSVRWNTKEKKPEAGAPDAANPLFLLYSKAGVLVGAGVQIHRGARRSLRSRAQTTWRLAHNGTVASTCCMALSRAWCTERTACPWVTASLGARCSRTQRCRKTS